MAHQSRQPSNDPSILGEPQWQVVPPTADPSEAKAEAALRRAAVRNADPDQQVEHTVWDEPALLAQGLREVPAGALTYERWLGSRWSEISLLRSWTVTLAISLAAGPWAVLAAFFNPSASGLGILGLVFFAPVVEECLKVALAWWVVEKRPFLFRSGLQILLCSAAGGALFAVIENLLYLHVYLDDPSPALIHWRWTVCTALHIGLSSMAGFGLWRMWRRPAIHRQRPRTEDFAPLLTAAMIVHGAYNALAILIEFAHPF